ncbi:hypothetical protein ACFTY8_05320 [Streptomyces mirabilis]|uniref:hypothetical protein n=1 Tax=Streptomyces mirabilis TaxID=68239 RepID=UPI00362648B2
MAANIQWDVFRKQGRHLSGADALQRGGDRVQAGRAPVAKGSAFYDLDELERCFGRTKS